MKKLQINFTTPEQSKRLLELGVPANSADCYYTQEEIEGNMYWFDLHIKREYKPHTCLHPSTIWGEILPCWSVGQLMEIYRLCKGRKWIPYDSDKKPLAEQIVVDFETEHLDFSNLED